VQIVSQGTGAWRNLCDDVRAAHASAVEVLPVSIGLSSHLSYDQCVAIAGKGGPIVAIRELSCS
jgi:hypothetical protein